MEKQRRLSSVESNRYGGAKSIFLYNEKNETKTNRRNLKSRLCVIMWTENILKTEVFENDDVLIIM